jgi:hypothetical protein
MSSRKFDNCWYLPNNFLHFGFFSEFFSIWYRLNYRMTSVVYGNFLMSILNSIEAGVVYDC